MNVYLQDNPPIRQQFFNPRRAPATGAIVVHTAECLADLVGSDTAAESVAGFIRTRTTAGSYHSIVDSDSIVRVGKYEWEMFHEGTGGNRFSLGLSCACEADSWPDYTERWVAATIHNAAIEACNMAEWIKAIRNIVIPAQRITEKEYRAGRPGFIGHGELDPTRRHDPGSKFPWDMFLNEYGRLMMADNDRIARLEARTEADWAYRNFLKRTPTLSELDYWTEIGVAQGVEAVRLGIQNSEEARGLAGAQ